MDYKVLGQAILKKLVEHPTYNVYYGDLLNFIREIWDTDRDYARKLNRKLRSYAAVYAEKHPGSFFKYYKESLLQEAKVDLDCYLLYLELKRNPEDRFYQPRRKVLKPIVDALQKLADGELRELFLSCPPRVGKLVADNTPILTTKGWKNHGDLKVGDYVFSPEGKPIKVIRVLPKHHTTHTVTFTDGTQIKCHFRHEWQVYDRRFHKTRILETQDLIGNLTSGPEEHVRGHRYNFMIPNKEPIQGVKVDLPVKPYSLGVWLGDGTNRAPCITIAKDDIEKIRGMEEDGYAVSAMSEHPTNHTLRFYFKDFRKELNKIGLCYSKERTEKYIPQEYLIAPIEDRLKLLAGLLDTDGHLRQKEHRYTYSTTDEKLRDGVISLISTFGWRVGVVMHEPTTSSSGIIGRRRVWEISFNPTMHIPCRLERKKLYTFSKQRRLAIKSIEPSEEEPGNCITVEGGMYLAGERMIPTHNTSLMIFYMTWLMGRDSEKPNLYSSYSDTITRAFYNGVLEVLEDTHTYAWYEVFGGHKIARTNASEETLDIDRKKHYQTLSCRSIDGSINGALDASGGFIIADDLVSGIEEAMNKERMVSKWAKVANNLIPRGKPSTRYLWIGTRWSIIDPAGVRMEMIENDPSFTGYKYKIINIPALNDKDESNFDYPYGVGFDTQTYRRIRAGFERNNDMASWFAQYMGQPIEREGSLFSPGDFRYFNGELPEGEPDRVFMAVDPAYGGGDFVAAPICVQYGEDIYVPATVYDNGDKKQTIPLIVKKAMEYGVSLIQVEVNTATLSYREELEQKMKEQGYRVTMTTKNSSSQTNKQQRIFDKAPDIREHMIFLESGKRPKDYTKFMENVFGFKMFLSKSGLKHQHDDAPDSLAQAIDMMGHTTRARYHIFKRPV